MARYWVFDGPAVPQANPGGSYAIQPAGGQTAAPQANSIAVYRNGLKCSAVADEANLAEYKLTGPWTFQFIDTYQSSDRVRVSYFYEQ